MTKKHSKKKLTTSNKVLIGISTFILTLVIILGLTVTYFSSKVNRVEIDRNDVLNTGKEPVKEEEHIINIALFGTDKYTDGQYTAADSIMILTLDTLNNKIKLTSLMRDCYLEVPGYENCNLNDTIIAGGPALTMKTINYNFNLQIDKFVHVNLNSLPKLIDKLGGVEIEISQDELQYINGYINNIDQENNTATSPVTSPGYQLLNGTQATAYCRIRYTDGRDYRRTERQREVLTALFQKFKDINLSEVPGLMNELLPLVSTNLTNTEILSISSKALSMGINDIEQARFPEDEDHTTEWTDMYHMIVDVDATTKKMHKFIYSLED